MRRFSESFRLLRDKNRRIDRTYRLYRIHRESCIAHPVSPVSRGMDGVRLEGLTLHVKDLERSVEFYSRIPGAQKMMHFAGKFAMFRLGEGRLGLLQAEEQSFHIELDTGKQLDAMYEKVLAAGFTPESPPTDRSWGRRDFHLLDPDGNLLEFD